MGRRFSEGSAPAGSGLLEDHVREDSGLRIANSSCILTTSLNPLGVSAIGSIGPLGTSGGAAKTEWTIPVWAAYTPLMPWPMTPTIVMTTAAPAVTKRIRVRISGVNQFGQPISEISPWVASHATLFVTAFPMSKVFAVVTMVEYQSVGYDSDTDAIHVGLLNVFDPTWIADISNDPAGWNLQYPQNNGIGTPLRISAYGSRTPVVGLVSARNWTQDAVANINPATGSLAGYTVGRSHSAFEGYSHKVGFHSPDWTLMKVQKVGAGEFRLGGQAHAAVPPPGRASDVIEVHVTLRCDFGTTARTHPQPYYTT